MNIFDLAWVKLHLCYERHDDPKQSATLTLGSLLAVDLAFIMLGLDAIGWVQPSITANLILFLIFYAVCTLAFHFRYKDKAKREERIAQYKEYAALHPTLTNVRFWLFMSSILLILILVVILSNI